MTLLKESTLRRLIRDEIVNGISSCKTKEIIVGDKRVTVEIADSQKLINRGLMYRNSLDENTGMLFVFPDNEQRGFWMKNTNIPLSTAFIDEDYRILNIENMIPHDISTVLSSGPAKYVLEMNQGWFDKHGIIPGFAIVID